MGKELQWTTIATMVEEHTQTANKHMKNCSTVVVLKEIQIKNIKRYHFTPTRTPKSEK